MARAGEPDCGEAKAYAQTHRVLCAHAGEDGQDARWLAPGEQCTRGQAGLEPGPAEACGFGRHPPGPCDTGAGR